MANKGLAAVAKYLKSKDVSKIVVMVGAGISTASGIPDFRTPGTGLYSNLEKYRLPYPEAIFDINYFRNNPAPFFQLAKELYPGNFKPNIAHFFIRILEQKRKLLRCYTQNIDGLETLCGLAPNFIVEAHGSFLRGTCLSCHANYTAEDIREDIFSDRIPKCVKCKKGIVKPNITFFGEELPIRFGLHFTDMRSVDFLFVMGTSLEVFPFASLPDEVPRYIPRVLLNRDKVGPFLFDPRRKDIFVPGELNENLEELIDLCSWTSDLHAIKKTFETEE